MTARRLRAHVLFEHGEDREPYGSAWIRLLRPLGHPAVADRIDARFSLTYDGSATDVLIVDRLWRPDVSVAVVDDLARRARASGAALVLAFDDNFADLALERPDWASAARIAAFDALVEMADGLLLTTDALAERYLPRCANVAVVPNALDERLLTGGRRRLLRGLTAAVAARRGTITVGYMGTYTHDLDLALIAPALRDVCVRHAGRVRIEILGVIAHAATLASLDGLPVRMTHPSAGVARYPEFVPWFHRTFRWDIAVSPLRASPFTACKSDVKFLDYAALGAAGIYSRHPAYSSTVQHGVTGWLAGDVSSDWAVALDRWIESPAERAAIAAQAREYVLGERTLAATGHRWAEALERLLAGRGAGGTTAPRSEVVPS